MLVPDIRLGVVDVQVSPVRAGLEVVDGQVLVNEQAVILRGTRRTISRIRVPVLLVSEPPGRVTACSNDLSQATNRGSATCSGESPLSFCANS